MEKKVQKKSNEDPVWVKVFSTSISSQVYADIVEGILKAAKIPCSLYRNETFNAYPKNTMPTDQIEVMVRPKYFTKAVSIVAELEENWKKRRAC